MPQFFTNPALAPSTCEGPLGCIVPTDSLLRFLNTLRGLSDYAELAIAHMQRETPTARHSPALGIVAVMPSSA